MNGHRRSSLRAGLSDILICTHHDQVAHAGRTEPLSRTSSCAMSVHACRASLRRCCAGAAAVRPGAALGQDPHHDQLHGRVAPEQQLQQLLQLLRWLTLLPCRPAGRSCTATPGTQAQTPAHTAGLMVPLPTPAVSTCACPRQRATHGGGRCMASPWWHSRLGLCAAVWPGSRGRHLLCRCTPTGPR